MSPNGFTRRTQASEVTIYPLTTHHPLLVWLDYLVHDRFIRRLALDADMALENRALVLDRFLVLLRLRLLFTRNEYVFSSECYSLCREISIVSK